MAKKEYEPPFDEAYFERQGEREAKMMHDRRREILFKEMKEGVEKELKAEQDPEIKELLEQVKELLVEIGEKK